MAYIEKVCEYADHDPDICKRDYSDTLQICSDHKDDFTSSVKGQDHIIYVQYNDLSEVYSRDMYDFYVFVGGQQWMRWYFNRRKWRKNLRKLLGVRELNIVNINSHKKLAAFEKLRKETNLLYEAAKEIAEAAE